MKKNSAVKKPKIIQNGISEAIMGFQPGGIGVQLSQTETLFKNERWYLVSNMWQLLSQMYVEHGLIQTLVDVPVDDGLRGGIIIKTKMLSDEEIEMLSATIEKEDDVNRCGRALKWNRLYGGAGLIIMTEQEFDQPLDVEAIHDSRLYFRPVDMWELFYDKQNTEGYDPTIQQGEVDYYSYYGERIHASRVIKMTGMVAPAFIRPRLRGWGFSVIESVVRSLNQYMKANDLMFEVLDEFKVDVYRLKNLVNTLMSPNGENQVCKRVQMANQQKNYNHAVVMDLEDEWQQKELSFTGIDTTFDVIRKGIACDLRMPLSKLFGIASAGFNSGEDDIENYNGMVESQVRSKAKYDLVHMVKLRCMQLFGMIPEDLTIDFKPLRVLSAEQEENVKDKKFTRLLQARQACEISSKDFLDGCNRESLLPIQIDSSTASIDPQEQSIIQDGANDPPRESSKLGSKKDQAKQPKEGEP